ncbi:MAG: choice-of-anchor D domain-containing protein [Verrucomicrobia bacterium]|nr:choice-of-anchor D domain-containing protein [Verrucomicrobiota bacterium]
MVHSQTRNLVPRRSLAARLLAGLASVLLAAGHPGSAYAAAGDPDATFNGSTNGTVFTTAVQPDGKVLVGGSFTTAGGAAHARLARFNADGTIDASFHPTVDNTIYTLAVQTDGRILLGGIFTTVSGVARQRLARLNADGTLDAGFNPTPDGNVHCLNLQPDGRIFVSGTFTFLAGAPANAGLARLNANGTFDNTWGTVTDGAVLATLLQPDGKILICGQFTSVNLEPHLRLARLHADGTTDSTFNASCDATPLALALQPDGKVLVAGSFVAPGGQFGLPRLARFNADGSVDATFTPNPNARVWGVSLQTDGKILAVGDFFQVGTLGTPRNRIARFHANGTLDTAFDPNVDGNLQAASFQGDGRILIGGVFGNVGTGVSAAHANIARLLNDSATQTLSVPDAGRIQWLRSGASIEVQQVTFELSTDGGTTYDSPLSAVRRTGGWEVTGLNLPASGRIRARARVPGGGYNGGNGLLEVAVNYGPLPASSEIGVEQPSGAALTTGGTKTLASGVVGTNPDSVFVIRNTGGAALSLSGSPRVAVSGPQAALFSVTAQPAASIAAGGASNFTVRFAPDSPGPKSATLTIANNDPTGAENPFIVQVVATGLRAGATGGWVNAGNFTVGTAGSSLNTNAWPATQSPEQAVDGQLLTKFLLFKTSNSAFGFTPLAPTVLNSLRLTTAEDAVERDPASYQIYGSATALPTSAGASVALSGLTLLASGSLSLPAARNDSSTVVTFPNANAYASYLVVFPTVKNAPGAANSTQISEVDLAFADLAGPTGGSLQFTPGSPVDAGVGLSVQFAGWTDPTAPLTYEVLIDDVVVSARGSTGQRNVVAPATPGVHVLKGRIYDGASNPTEVTQNFTVNSPLESWRNLYFGTTANAGNAADGFDFDGDGLGNLLEFAFGLDPTVASAAQLPQPQFDGNNLSYTFATPAGVSGVTYGAQWTTDLAAGTWQPVADTGLGAQHVFSVPVTGQTRVFLRLTVSAP